MAAKICSKCDRESPIENYYLAHLGSETRRKECKDCFKARKRPDRARNTINLEQLAQDVQQLGNSMQEIISGYTVMVENQNKLVQIVSDLQKQNELVFRN